MNIKTIGSGSRSRHGSKKRTFKTRSSLNIKNTIPLNNVIIGSLP